MPSPRHVFIPSLAELITILQSNHAQLERAIPLEVEVESSSNSAQVNTSSMTSSTLPNEIELLRAVRECVNVAVRACEVVPLLERELTLWMLQFAAIARDLTQFSG